MHSRQRSAAGWTCSKEVEVAVYMACHTLNMEDKLAESNTTQIMHWTDNQMLQTLFAGDYLHEVY